MTNPSEKPKRRFKDTLSQLVQSFLDAPVNPIQHLLRTAMSGDVLLQDVEYDLQSANGTLETKYETTQKELFEVINRNLKLEQTLQDSDISYQKATDKPIIIHYRVNDIITNYDLSASNQKNKAAQVATLQQEVRELEASYEELAEDLEAQKIQQTYLTLKVALHGLPDPFAKSEVEEYQDAVASLLEQDKKERDAKYEKTRVLIARKQTIAEIKESSDQQYKYHTASFIESIKTKRDQKEYTPALELCEFITAIEPTNTHAHYFAATIHETQGNTTRIQNKDQARKHYESAKREYELAGRGSSAAAGLERTLKLICSLN